MRPSPILTESASHTRIFPISGSISTVLVKTVIALDAAHVIAPMVLQSVTIAIAADR